MLFPLYKRDCIDCMCIEECTELLYSKSIVECIALIHSVSRPPQKMLSIRVNFYIYFVT